MNGSLPKSNYSKKEDYDVNSSSFFISSLPAQPVMFKGIGVLPQRARGGVCLDTDTARTVTIITFKHNNSNKWFYKDNTMI